MLRLKLRYFGHLIRRNDSLEKTLMLKKIKGRRRRDYRGWDGWMASPTQWTWVWVDSGSWWWTGRPGMLWFMGSQRGGHDWVTELNWTTLVIAFLPRSKHLLISILVSAAAAAAAKSFQSCPTLFDPWDGSPPGSPFPGILQARTLEWVAISFSNAWKWKVKVKSLSHVRLWATP